MSRRRKRYPKEVIACSACEGTCVDADGNDCPECQGTGKQEREYEPEFDKEERLERQNDE